MLTLKGISILLIAGILIGFGTRYADGCTSGHAITGLSSLQLPSLIAVIGFFIGGLLMTWIFLPLISDNMKNIKFLILGIFFGIVLTKAEVISWYRIYEMFKFQSFHMYGIIGSAVAVSMILMYFFKNGKIKDYLGKQINIKEKKKGFIRTLVGGTIFGLGWALAGACPAPIFVLIGHGILPFIVVLFGAMLGALIYGILSKKLPN